MTQQGSSPRPFLWRLSNQERRFIVLAGDLCCGVVALLVALYLWAQGDTWLDFSWQFLRERPGVWFYLLPVIWVVMNVELYDVNKAARWNDTVVGLLVAVGVCVFLYLLVYFASAPNSLPRRGVATFIVAVFLFTLLWRIIYIRVFTASAFQRRMLIVGAGRAGKAMAQVLNSMVPPPFQVVGFVDDGAEKAGTTIEGYPVLCSSTGLMEIIQRERVSDLIFAISGEMHQEMFKALLDAEENGILVTPMPTMYEEILGRVPIFLLQSDWIKRMLDMMVAMLGMVVFLVSFPLIAMMLLLDDGSPLFITQDRVGKAGKVFKIIKYRTMRRDAEKDGKPRFTAEKDERVTRVGRFLRMTHIDEIPQLINVLQGATSMVGPRSERPEWVGKFQQEVPFYRGRLLVKPGITGWAQINQKYAASAEETAIKLEYDLYYIKHRNLILDVTILLRTVGTVIGFKGRA
jgi:exopolysaccharide biosynthesis polyprenyl glycosylphosphotransferase